MITSTQLRAKFLAFFQSKQHAVIPGKSLIPENDPTVLFTTAGMHPLVPYLLGEPHPAGKRLVDYQKCVRTGDIDEVGDPSHLTCFEMLGNWSLGDYFKKESIAWSWEFLTGRDWLNLDPAKLSVTVFEGDANAPRDEESASHWLAAGVPAGRIAFLPAGDNWWAAGPTGPCGPDTEIFYWLGAGLPPAGSNKGSDSANWMEIWNNVFMEYNRVDEKNLVKLPKQNVDTGMGLERTIAVLNGQTSVYQIDIYQAIITAIGRVSGYSYGADPTKDMSVRIIADHTRTATFIIGDPKGVSPGNIGAGYVLRRLIRRAVRHSRKLGIEGGFLGQLAEVVIGQFAGAYPELAENRQRILDELAREEAKFLETLQKGEHEFEKMLPNLLKNPQKIMSGRLAFKLYDTYGFPIELTLELAAENGLTVNRAEFDEAFKKHQELSRASTEGSFKGGLAEQSEITTRYHTATHLLQQALKMVLGDHVAQKGSNITAERLRFDFSHPEPMTPEQLQRVQEIVNQQIARDLPVTMEILPLEQAKASGATALFGEKYDALVKVYTMGDFSKEVCGGPHVERTGLLGKFIIQKEQSSSAGVRRIKAVLE
ncbi:MAG: alanine--tRNA ligase [Spirochaetes bacterium GWD1_61_31]|nr:MAG: alanine--tRNA ligase [Spirochaetes bacterium GWB1_60_80]OHD36915.1 MAG: alanine--tRNA ligase [Spirochaetes bacterium GWD1_61_31]OHD42619.1 MAG: alanine--tRNA ligase [Spirochaetes bacterium GWE1_60_18]OHD58002.1 MAG: alanine--tRNA ligase [Spirochaetes bacterium GWF1_60_12]HAP42628.1 alanine--tRNA ligase [Spirochaetaceae bacterium]